MDDSKEFEHTKKAMEVCGINKQEQMAILSVLSAILYLGNIEFTQGNAGDGAEFGEVDSLQAAAELLSVDAQVLGDALIHPRIKAGKELIAQHLSVVKAA